MPKRDVYALLVPSTMTCYHVYGTHIPLEATDSKPSYSICDVDFIEDCSTEYENGMDNAFAVRAGEKQVEVINVPVVVFRVVSSDV